MDGMNANLKESRKKFLVPLVVLLLCAVSLVGVAYAYSSSVTVMDNTVTGQEYVLEMQNGTGAAVTDPIELDCIRITGDTTISAEDSVAVKASVVTAGGANVFAGMLKLKDTSVEGSSADRAISYTVVISGEKDGIINYGDVTTPAAASGSIGYTIDVKLYKDYDEGTKEYSNEITSGTATSLTFVSQVAKVYYVVTVKVTDASSTGIIFNNGTPTVDVDAVKTLFDLEKKFTLTFTALEPTA